MKCNVFVMENIAIICNKYNIMSKKCCTHVLQIKAYSNKLVFNTITSIRQKILIFVTCTKLKRQLHLRISVYFHSMIIPSPRYRLPRPFHVHLTMLVQQCDNVYSTLASIKCMWNGLSAFTEDI